MNRRDFLATGMALGAGSLVALLSEITVDPKPAELINHMDQRRHITVPAGIGR